MVTFSTSLVKYCKFRRQFVIFFCGLVLFLFRFVVADVYQKCTNQVLIGPYLFVIFFSLTFIFQFFFFLTLNRSYTEVHILLGLC